MTTALLIAAAQGEAIDGMAGGFRAFGAIALVLALVCVLAWLARRGTLRFPGSRASTPVRVEAITPLGERRSLVVVAVEGRRLLLGLTPAQVSLVNDLAAHPPDFGAALDARIAPPTAGPV